MKHLLLLIFTTIYVIHLFGQTKFVRNNIYLEAGGNGLFGSINYERQLATQPGFGIRLGVGFHSENMFYLTIPVGIVYLLNLTGDKSFIDAGLGATWSRIEGKLFQSSISNKGEDFVSFIPSIGYRHQTKQNLMWRISITPIVYKHGLVPWTGLSIGKRF